MEIVVTELPYQVSCNAIAARIQELVDAGDLEGIADVNDNSAGGKTSLVITLRRDANANVVLNNLFKQTQLQTSFPVNMVALVDGVPRTLNLVQALDGYIAHQIEVITRRSQYRLDKARRDEEIQEGLLRALNVIDEVIALIRASEDRAAARERPHASSSGSPSCRPSTSSRCASASSPGCRASTSSSGWRSSASTSASSRRSWPTTSAEGGHQGRPAGHQGAVRHAAPGRGHARHR